MNGTQSGNHGTNGIHKENEDEDQITSMDESTSSDTPDPQMTESGLDRRELVRIIIQAVESLGYINSARALEQEAKVEAMSPQMRRLRDCVLMGRWDLLEDVLDQVNVFKSENDARAARFVLYEQKFLELLEAMRTADALECLRNDLTRLSPDPKLLHKLPLLCMCTSPDEVRSHAGWPGAGPRSRKAVLEKLQKYIPSSELLQENRLENIVCQTIEHQKRVTMFPYTRQRRVSLLEDMVHCKDRVPKKMLHCLKGHDDEVWFVQFSHRGEYLASASKDASVIIWKCRALMAGECGRDDVILHKLRGHSQTICFLSWSPNDRRLLSCGNDRSIRMWDIKTGLCTKIFEKHTEQVTACAWMPHGRSFVSGAHDSRIFEWNAESGECSAAYLASARVNDVSISKDGKVLIATCSDNVIQIFDTTSKEQVASMKESVSITSLFLSNDSESLLINTNSNENPNMQDPEIHIWNLRDMEIKQSFKGFKQTRFVIRGCFGGHNQMLVLCGSEDNLVYIWERRTGELIAQLDGHQGTVNTVACSETDENLFASGSDDKTIIIWGVKPSSET
eukprot:GFKZ01010796.1.p1 GENE.GFKZ01010796.1~~GFKZ01010796.1.p1  ORF type:complete len:564 (-),score=73.32 GFKZ01010796.1:377-2068(-)